MSEPIQLDPNTVTAKQAARYLGLIKELVEENAQLETYVAQLLTRITEAKPDAWGDTPAQKGA